MSKKSYRKGEEEEVNLIEQYRQYLRYIKFADRNKTAKNISKGDKN